MILVIASRADLVGPLLAEVLFKNGLVDWLSLKILVIMFFLIQKD